MREGCLGHGLGGRRTVTVLSTCLREKWLRNQWPCERTVNTHANDKQTPSRNSGNTCLHAFCTSLVLLDCIFYPAKQKFAGGRADDRPSIHLQLLLDFGVPGQLGCDFCLQTCMR